MQVLTVFLSGICRVSTQFLQMAAAAAAEFSRFGCFLVFGISACWATMQDPTRVKVAQSM